MSLQDVMLEQLAISRNIVADGHEVVPAWRIGCPDGDWLILTRFDPDKPGQRDRAVHLVKRFMVWKLALSFVQTAEAWLGPVVTREGQEAVIAVGCSRSERLGVMQRIQRGARGVDFGAHEWLSPDQLDPLYWTLLPSRKETVTAEETAEFAVLFGEDGELPAHKM